MSTGRVGTPSRRSVPGVLPVVVELMSMRSSDSWNTNPISSPNAASASRMLRSAPETMPPKSADAAISEPVLSAMTWM